jgi:hypothetical protein
LKTSIARPSVEAMGWGEPAMSMIDSADGPGHRAAFPHAIAIGPAMGDGIAHGAQHIGIGTRARNRAEKCPQCRT